jgi:hypothetical protein
LVERIHGKDEVSGSNPDDGSNGLLCNASPASSGTPPRTVLAGHGKDEVSGSNPDDGSMKNTPVVRGCFCIEFFQIEEPHRSGPPMRLELFEKGLLQLDDRVFAGGHARLGHENADVAHVASVTHRELVSDSRLIESKLDDCCPLFRTFVIFHEHGPVERSVFLAFYHHTEADIPAGDSEEVPGVVPPHSDGLQAAAVGEDDVPMTRSVTADHVSETSRKLLGDQVGRVGGAKGDDLGRSDDGLIVGVKGVDLNQRVEHVRSAWCINAVLSTGKSRLDQALSLKCAPIYIIK